MVPWRSRCSSVADAIADGRRTLSQHDLVAFGEPVVRFGGGAHRAATDGQDQTEARDQTGCSRRGVARPAVSDARLRLPALGVKKAAAITRRAGVVTIALLT